jgi:hypothetical protein
MKQQLLSKDIASRGGLTQNKGRRAGMRAWEGAWQLIRRMFALCWVTWRVWRLDWDTVDQICDWGTDKVHSFTKTKLGYGEDWAVLWTKLCALVVKWGWAGGTKLFSEWRLNDWTEGGAPACVVAPARASRSSQPSWGGIG